MADGARLRVLESFGRPGPQTNPYIIQLGTALGETEGVELVRFSWRAALTGGYDVVHLHWPEVLMHGSTPLKSLGKRWAMALLLARLAVRRTPVVRTVHNLDLPSDVTPMEQRLLRAAERLTTVRIRLNPATPVPPDTPAVTILHGHFRDWFAPYATRPAEPGRFVFAGMIRRYKGAEHLLDVFAGTNGRAEELTLVVAGRPSSAELADHIRAAVAKDPRVTADLGFVTDEDLVARVTEAELVVLPYRFMHNSSVVLAALSLDRPVLVPRNAVTEDLAREVGEGWVYLFDGELGVEDLLAALRSVRADRSAGHLGRPDLSARSWASVGEDHLCAFRLAVELGRSRRAGRPSGRRARPVPTGRAASA